MTASSRRSRNFAAQSPEIDAGAYPHEDRDETGRDLLDPFRGIGIKTCSKADGPAVGLLRQRLGETNEDRPVAERQDGHRSVRSRP